MTSRSKGLGRQLPLAIFVMLAGVLLTLGWGSYRYLVTSLHEREVDRLRAIDDLKAQQVAAWFGARMADARVLAGRPTALSVLSDTDGLHGLRTRRSLEQMQQAYGYLSIELFDRDGVRVSVAGADLKGPNLLTGALLTRLDKTRQPELIDFYRTANPAHPVGLVVVAAIYDLAEENSAVKGYAVLHIDPDRELYPMIQTWPVPSASAETELVRLEDDHITFLNRMRHSPAEPMTVRLAMAPKLPATQAIQQPSTWGDGVDYRGVPVLFSSHVVPGTPWIMIAKIDRDEVLGELLGVDAARLATLRDRQVI